MSDPNLIAALEEFESEISQIAPSDDAVYEVPTTVTPSPSPPASSPIRTQPTTTTTSFRPRSVISQSHSQSNTATTPAPSPPIQISYSAKPVIMDQALTIDELPVPMIPVAPVTSQPGRPVAPRPVDPTAAPGSVRDVHADDKKQAVYKKKRHLRAAGGELWEDPTLDEWPMNDYRIFCGDLGNEVNDATLANAFRKYASFAKAKVVRDKHTMKPKGYGFVSFLDPYDCAAALREMDGKYVGNRPIKLRKSTWAERDLGNAKKKKKLFKPTTAK